MPFMHHIPQAPLTAFEPQSVLVGKGLHVCDGLKSGFLLSADHDLRFGLRQLLESTLDNLLWCRLPGPTGELLLKQLFGVWG